MDTLCKYLTEQVIASFEQIRRRLGNPARATVFRLFGKAEVLSSYSDRGQYYTLRSIPRFNRQGLWAYDTVRFSRFGNLLQTIKALVEESRYGCNAQELERELGVETKHALVQLTRRNQLRRIGQGGVYVYVSIKASHARKQQQARRQQAADLPTGLLGPKACVAVEEAKAALLLFWATLDEQQRRLYAGLESTRLGYGGDQYVAELFGIERHTVARGREELLRCEPASNRVREPGAGRLSLGKKRLKSSRTSKSS